MHSRSPDRHDLAKLVFLILFMMNVENEILVVNDTLTEFCDHFGCNRL
jgi:hypothetical protein